MKKVDPQDIYRTHMIDVKLRIVSASEICNSPHVTLHLPAFDIEYCSLQIRRIVESITFSAMIREESRYRKAREIENIENPRKPGDATKDWKAPDILKTLVKLSPLIFPLPVKEPQRQQSGSWHFDEKQMTVNHGRLIEIYRRASGFLHAKNPLVNDYAEWVEEERSKYIDAPRWIKKDISFLRSLVWKHAVVNLEWTDPDNPQILDNPESAWIVDFGNEEDQKVSITIGKAL